MQKALAIASAHGGGSSPCPDREATNGVTFADQGMLAGQGRDRLLTATTSLDSSSALQVAADTDCLTSMVAKLKESGDSISAL
jgi:hypothetical protein